MKKRIIPYISLLSLLLTGCNNANQSTVIYTSFYPIYDFTKRIVGDIFEVQNLTPVGVEPHDYELTTLDLRNLSDASLIFFNGLGLEHYATSLPKDIQSKTTVVSSDIELLQIDGINDPHVWLNPLNAVIMMGHIKDKLISFDAEHAEQYETNYTAACEDFLALDQEIKEQSDGLLQRYFAVSHAAFGYFADRYDLHQVYVNGLSPEQEPSAKDMEEIAETIREYNITTIFTEELVSPKIAEAIARETGAKLETLNPLEGLSEEELQTEDYLSVMRSNFAKIKEAAK